MPLTYYLIDNPITPDPSDRRAVPLVNGSATIDDVIDRMISRGSTVTKAEALSVFEELSLAVETLVKDGNSINTPLFKLSLTIAGVFDNDEESFTPGKHEVKLRMNPGARLRELERNVTVEKTVVERSKPMLLHYNDSKSETVDDVITPNDTGKISGSLLKFEESEADQGIFFVNKATGVATRVTRKLVRHMPSDLIFINPVLTPGTYRLEVRSVFKGSKGVRVGALPYDLIVP